MNRRRTLTKPPSLRRLLAPRRNRRLRPKVAEVRAPRPRLQLRALGGRVLAVTLAGCRLLALLLVLGGIGYSGYYGYQRVMRSTYFLVKQLEVQGVRRIKAEEISRLIESVKGRNIFSLELKALRRQVASHPWVRRAELTRQLPDRIVIEVVEQEAQAVLLLGHLYLVNAEGEVFKRAALHEADGLTVISGIDRLQYLNRPAAARQQIQRALGALRSYRAAERPALSEVKIEAQGELALFLRDGGVAVRLGQQLTDERLRRFDRVWAALGPATDKARVVFLDNEIRAERVIVRLGSSL